MIINNETAPLCPSVGFHSHNSCPNRALTKLPSAKLTYALK
jgi:hypothetical protein